MHSGFGLTRFWGLTSMVFFLWQASWLFKITTKLFLLSVLRIFWGAFLRFCCRCSSLFIEVSMGLSGDFIDFTIRFHSYHIVSPLKSLYRFQWNRNVISMETHRELTENGENKPEWMLRKIATERPSPWFHAILRGLIVKIIHIFGCFPNLL